MKQIYYKFNFLFLKPWHYTRFKQRKKNDKKHLEKELKLVKMFSNCEHEEKIFKS